MQAFSNTIKGSEILFFEDAEIVKFTQGKETFASMGPFYVLYFKDYNRFVLQLNDWKFPLIRRLNIFLSSDNTDISDRTYILPGFNDSTFELRLRNIPSHQALINFETILSHNSLFSLKGEDTSSRKIETSPDDKLVRHPLKDTGAKEIISGNVKNIVHKVMNKAATLKSGTKNLTSRKLRVTQLDIKNKDFKSSAKPSFKKDYFSSNEKSTYELFSKRRSNKNLTEAKELAALMKTSDTPMHTIFRDDIEESILRNKDLASHGKLTTFEKKEEKKGLIQNLKENISTLASKATLKKDSIITESRDTMNTLKEEKFTQLESTHHSEA